MQSELANAESAKIHYTEDTKKAQRFTKFF